MTPGSILLQRGFFIFAFVLVLIARTLIKTGSRAAGDRPDQTDALTRRFYLWALGWVLIVIVVSATGVFERWDARPPAFPFLALAIIVLGIAFSRSAFADRLVRLPLAHLVL